MSSARHAGLDVARAAAIFLVVLQHAWTMLKTGTSDSPLTTALYSNVFVNVPLFVMISGALQMKKESALSFWKKRMPRVWVPYLFWGTCVYIISFAMGKYPDIGSWHGMVANYFHYIIVPERINQAYWFVGLITLLYLAAPILQLFIPKMSAKALAGLSILCLAWVAAKSLLGLGSLPLSIDIYLAYFICGYSIRGIFSRKTLIAGLCVFAVVTLALTIMRTMQTEPPYAMVFIQACSLYAALGSLSHCPEWMGILSRRSYFIYLTHFVLIGAMYALTPCHPVLTTVIVIIAECAVANLFDQTKIFKKLS